MKRNGLRLDLWLSFAAVAMVFVGARAWAIPMPIQIKPGKISPTIRAGIIAGGQANDEFAILSIQTESAVSGAERLVIVYGDGFGRPLKGEPGFFQVSLDRDSRRIVIDMAQVNRTAVDHKELARILSTSKMVAGSDMTMDPHDSSTNITLNMKSAVTLSVVSEAHQQGKLILEFRETGGRAP